MGERLEMTREARIENVAVLRDSVEEAARRAGLDEPTCWALKLTVDEACTNIVRYAYANMPAGLIHLECHFDPEAVVVVLTDHGRPFDPNDVPVPDLSANVEDLPVGGLGIHIIRQLMDEVTFTFDPVKGNRLRLVKRLKP